MKLLPTKNGKKADKVLPSTFEKVENSSQIEVMQDRSQAILSNLTLAVSALAFGFMFLGFGFVMNALRPIPNLVIDGDTASRVQPLKKQKASEPAQITHFLENRFPLLYTWVGLIPNSKDLTGTTFIKDPTKTVETPQGAVKIPTSVYNEQFILAEEIRKPTMEAIAELISKTGSQIWQTDPNNPGIGISYRFVFGGRPQFPKEVEPGRWKVVVNGTIVKVQPTLVGPPETKKLQDLNFEVYVRRAGRNPAIAIGEDLDGEGRDLIAHGKSSGYEIEAMLPFKPTEKTLPRPQFKEREEQ